MTASTAFTLHFPFVHDIEAALFARAPAAKLQGKPVYMEATVKAFNMSASYATSFGCGAREQIQNWFDQCRVTVSDRSPDFVQVEPAVYSETLLRYKIREAKLYVGTGEQQILGILLEATDQEGRQLLLLKKYGAQMTLDSLILGESSKRNDKYLAGITSCNCRVPTMNAVCIYNTA